MASARRCPSSDGRSAVRGTSGSHDLEANQHVLPRRRVEELGRVPAADRERDVPIGVLVEDHVAFARVGERACRDCVVAIQTELDLNEFYEDGSVSGWRMLPAYGSCVSQIIVIGDSNEYRSAQQAEVDLCRFPRKAHRVRWQNPYHL